MINAAHLTMGGLALLTGALITLAVALSVYVVLEFLLPRDDEKPEDREP